MARYRYDLLRRRIASEWHLPDGTFVRRLYLWEGPRLAAVLDGEGQILRQFLWLGWRPVAILTPEGAFHVHTDHRGAPTEVTDEKGRIVWTADYAPFGRAHVDPDPDGDGKAFVLRLRLPGQWADPATGLHYNLARWYDPESGRYLSPDPLGLAAGPNPYAYAAADPVNRIDPLGLRVELYERRIDATPLGGHTFLGRSEKSRFFRPSRGQGRPRDGSCTRKCMTIRRKSKWAAKHYRADQSARAD